MKWALCVGLLVSVAVYAADRPKMYLFDGPPNHNASFLPAEPDTVREFISIDPGFCQVEAPPTRIVRIIPPDSQMIAVPVWWVKQVMARLDSLEAQGRRGQSFIVIPDSVATRYRDPFSYGSEMWAR